MRPKAHGLCQFHHWLHEHSASLLRQIALQEGGLHVALEGPHLQPGGLHEQELACPPGSRRALRADVAQLLGLVAAHHQPGLALGLTFPSEYPAHLKQRSVSDVRPLGSLHHLVLQPRSDLGGLGVVHERLLGV
eukprot:10458653-Alexandrium_andersonii.AAC.1